MPEKQRKQARSPAWTFLFTRRAWWFLVVAAVLGALTAWWGTAEAPVPTAIESGTATIPIWRLLAMAAAVLPVLALHSHLSDLEVVATNRLRRTQRAYLAGMSLSCAAVYFGISAFALHPLLLVIVGRSWVGWLGLALLAGVVLGWRLAWTLPALVAVVLSYWGYLGGDEYEWWEFSARPHDDLPSLLLSMTLLATGLAAYGATPGAGRRYPPWRRSETKLDRNHRDRA